MASSGFNQPSPHGEDKANAKARRDEQDDEVMRLLQAITGDSGSAEKATNGIDMSEAMNSRIQVPLDAKLNRERLQTLAEFYEAERALSRAMLAFAGNLRTSHQNSKGEKMYMALRKCAIRELLAKYGKSSLLNENTRN
jgi:hypothetical protein